MIKTVGIVSLSSGIIGEEFIQFEVEIGLRRLREYGLKVKFMPNALKGIDHIREHPEKRAEDLLQAFRDPEIDMILCAIGGDDTFRLLPYLFGHDELREAVSQKIFRYHHQPLYAAQGRLEHFLWAELSYGCL